MKLMLSTSTGSYHSSVLKTFRNEVFSVAVITNYLSKI